jgi:hypothetical protein
MRCAVSRNISPASHKHCVNALVLGDTLQGGVSHVRLGGRVELGFGGERRQQRDVSPNLKGGGKLDGDMTAQAETAPLMRRGGAVRPLHPGQGHAVRSHDSYAELGITSMKPTARSSRLGFAR